jgi:type VI secretion system secreted protein Hcp
VAYYLQIPGIDGEVTDRDYAGWIDVESVKFGDPGDRGGGGSGGGGTGRINLTDVSLTKKWDKASGELMKATATGKHFPKVTLVGTREKHKFIEYVFEDCIVTSYATREHEGQQYDNFVLNFEKVTFNYS